MQEKLGLILSPNWIVSDKFHFEVSQVLKDSLYYPGSSFYGEPVRLFRGNVHSFVFVDYGSSREQLFDQVQHHGFEGFRLIHNESISEKQLTPHGWSPKIYPNMAEYRIPQNVKPFCEWMIFENESKERFSLLYLCADAVASISALYHSNHIKPRIVMLVPPPKALYPGWTDFSSESGIFARTLLSETKLIPDFLVLSSSKWHSFPFEICSLDTNTQSKVWGSNNFV